MSRRKTENQGQGYYDQEVDIKSGLVPIYNILYINDDVINLFTWTSRVKIENISGFKKNSKLIKLQQSTFLGCVKNITNQHSSED